MRFPPDARQKHRDAFVRWYREEYDIPVGPMDFLESAFCEANTFAHMLFMDRHVFGLTETGVECVGFLGSRDVESDHRPEDETKT